MAAENLTSWTVMNTIHLGVSEVQEPFTNVTSNISCTNFHALLKYQQNSQGNYILMFTLYTAMPLAGLKIQYIFMARFSRGSFVFL